MRGASERRKGEEQEVKSESVVVVVAKHQSFEQTAKQKKNSRQHTEGAKSRANRARSKAGKPSKMKQKKQRCSLIMVVAVVVIFLLQEVFCVVVGWLGGANTSTRRCALKHARARAR